MPAPGLRVLPEGLAPERAVLTEPLSDALHAVYRAGDVACARVLVTGAGPIGSLAVAVLRRRGTAQVLVSDLTEHSLAVARAAGVTATLSADHPDDWADLPPVDVVVECSGTPPGLRSALTAVRRGGQVVLLGLLPPGQVPFAGNLVVTREFTLTGAFRFGDEINEAIVLLDVACPSTRWSRRRSPWRGRTTPSRWRAIGPEPRRCCSTCAELSAGTARPPPRGTGVSVPDGG
jgi:L-idonate 5-dehydrogenase